MRDKRRAKRLKLYVLPFKDSDTLKPYECVWCGELIKDNKHNCKKPKKRFNLYG